MYSNYINKMRKGRMRPSLKIKEAARLLLSSVEEHIDDVFYKTRLIEELRSNGDVFRELNMEMASKDGELSISGVYRNHTDSLYSIRHIKQGTKAEILEWVNDERTLKELALELEDLYEHTYTWD